jgi:hypothetical protein
VTLSVGLCAKKYGAKLRHVERRSVHPWSANGGVRRRTEHGLVSLQLDLVAAGGQGAATQEGPVGAFNTRIESVPTLRRPSTQIGPVCLARVNARNVGIDRWPARVSEPEWFRIDVVLANDKVKIGRRSAARVGLLSAHDFVPELLRQNLRGRVARVNADPVANVRIGLSAVVEGNVDRASGHVVDGGR